MFINNIIFEHDKERLEPKVKITKDGYVSIEIDAANYANNKSASISHTIMLSKDTAEELSRVIMYAIYANELENKE